MLGLVVAGKAPWANRLLRADEREVDRNNGTTKVFPTGRGDAEELFGP